jgi:hypothetical protein
MGRPITTSASGLVTAVLLAAGCAQMAEPSFELADKPGSLGPLDAAYDKTKWRWVKNADGRVLLSHVEVRRCFIDPQPNEDFNDPGITLKKEEKTIGNARYEVVNVYDKREFWEAIYVRSGAKEPLLSVYSEGRCRQEAEGILQNYEKTTPKQAEK